MDDGIAHGEGICECGVYSKEGYKSKCAECGEMYLGKVGGSLGCTKCGKNVVKDLGWKPDTPGWQQEILDSHGVGKKSWINIRKQWTKPTKKQRKPTPYSDESDFEDAVVEWISDGGTGSTRPLNPSIPLGFTIQCLQQLDTWEPIGMKK